jgi:hypothetical protein
MNIDTALAAVRDALISAEPDYFSKGNAFVTDSFQPLPQLNRWYVEVWYAGSADFPGSGGGNLIRHYLIGVGVGTRLTVDLLGTREKQTLEMIQLLKRVTNVLQQGYDPTMWVEPLHLVGESEVKTFTVEAPDAQGAWALQTYAALSPITAGNNLQATLADIYP